MNRFFDTSALIPAFLEDHEHHEASFKALRKCDKANASCAAHSLAEMYATLTRLPGKHRMSGDQAMLFLEEVRERLTPVSLDSEECFAALRAAAARGVVGGTVYDLLVAHCALKARASTIYTWNLRHFQQLGPEIARLLKTP